MNWRPVTALLGVAALLFAACQQGNNAPTVIGGKALIAEPTTGVTFSQDFNPYDSNSVSSAMGTRSIVNEPLVEFDELDPTAAGTHPWLATAFQFSNGGKDIQLTIRQNVKFNDGSSFGPADVAATYKVVPHPNLNPQTNHAWFASGSTVTLYFNLNPGNGGATGIGEVAVRKAISYGIDRNALALLGESGYERAASSSSALILPNQKAFLPADGSLVGDLSTSGNVPDAAAAKAQKLPAGMDVYEILKSAGWAPPATAHYDTAAGTFKSGGNCDGSNTANCWTKGGQIIKFSVYDPVPFSDYWENAALISQELQPLGMDVTTKPAQGYSDWNTTLTSNPSGWQTMIHWGAGGSIPYTQYNDWFASTAGQQIGYSNADA